MSEIKSPLFSLKSFRLRFGLLLTFGLWAVWTMRLNLNMAIPCMVKPKFASVSHGNSSLVSIAFSSAKCERSSGNLTVMGYNGDLDWSPSMQSLLFSASFYSSFVTAFFAGYIVDRFEPKKSLIAASLIYTMIGYLSPIIANHSFWSFFSLRLLLGLVDSFIFPCLNSLAARWFPRNEKATITGIYTSGIQLAAGGSSLISSFLCLSVFGWPSIFYFFAIMGTIWCILCGLLVTNWPQKSRFVNEDEKKYLELHTKSTKKISKNITMPWKEILLSKEVFACNFCNFSSNFVLNLNQLFLPTFLKEVLLLPMHYNGFYTMIPFCAEFLSKNTMGILSDYLKRTKGINATKLGKIFQSVSSFGSAIGLLLLVSIPTCERPSIAIPFMILYGLTFSCLSPGYYTSVISIAPAYTGTITSMGQILGGFGNLAAPLSLALTSYLEIENRWLIVYGTAACCQIVAGLIFLFWGSSEVLPWAEEKSVQQEQEKKVDENNGKF
ncbi:unnamed protein product, partial [Mesorhabditis belari]|uniref:Major facilitator superfamily (MFS) profile domain-containing protein n=1 Tax=Mesorhabditis belari TaxID=2138241 RepID=A0AAF3EQX8_9BILA